MFKFLLFLSLLTGCFAFNNFTKTHSGIISFDESNFGKFYGQVFQPTLENFSQVMLEVEVLNITHYQEGEIKNEVEYDFGIPCKRNVNLIILRDNYFMGKNFERLSSKNVSTWRNSDMYHYTLSDGKLQLILQLPESNEKLVEYSLNPYFMYIMVDEHIINSSENYDCNLVPTTISYTRYQK